MRIVSFAEAAGYGIKEKVPAVRGKITKINDYNTGDRNGEQWSIQNLELCDPNDARLRLRVKLWNREEVPKQWVNKIAIIECVEGERGPKGVTMEQDTYKWREGQPIKKQLEVQCGDGAIFALADQGQGGQNAPAPTRQQAASAPQGGGQPKGVASGPAPQTGNQSSTAQTHPHRAGTKMTEDQKRAAVAEAAKFVARKIAGFRIILKAMDQLAEERKAGSRPLSTDQFQGMTTSIWIAGDRAFMWDALPMTPELMEKYWPQPTEPAKQDGGQQ